MLWTLVSVGVLLSGLGAFAPPITFAWSADHVEVTGLDDALLAPLRSWKADDPRWGLVLRVSIAIDTPTTQTNTNAKSASSPAPAIAGRHAATSRSIRFTPAYRFLPDRSYEATYDPQAIPGGAAGRPRAIETNRFTFKRAGAYAAVKIDRVYPTRSELPENQLKFYVHFTGPMSRGHAYDFVRLIDDAGKEVDLPFLAIAEELWDSDGKRLTLLFDPGRVKRDLKPRLESGAILESGRRYTFEILSGWPDAEGRPLEKGARKNFAVIAHDGSSPDWRSWRLTSPRAGSRDPLVVSLDEPLDHALLTRLPRVLDASGRTVAGTAVSRDEERQWAFTPEHPWSSGAFELAVDPSLEDLAGNRLDRVFDRDVFERIDTPGASQTLFRRGFEIRP